MATPVSSADAHAVTSPKQAEVASVRGEVSSRASILILLAATLAMMLPFVNKPFHIDDPLFIWAAKHIRQNIASGGNPADFFGFNVNWYDRSQPMHEVTQNPPLACYALAAVSYLTGWNEVGLHAAFLLPAIGVVLGTWILARRMCDRPVLAGLAVVCSPIFIVSSTNVMCDTLMTCLWIWGIILWKAGLDRDSQGRLAAAAALVALASLTKYFAMCLIPLLILYTLARSFRLWSRLLWMLIPVSAIWGYQELTRHLYGHGMLSGAADYAKNYYRQKSSQHVSVKPVATFAFTGGCLISLLFYLPRLARRIWVPLLGLILAAGLAATLYHFNFKYIRPIGTEGYRHTTWDITSQAGLLIVLGLAVCALIPLDLFHVWRDTRGNRQTPATRQALADSLLLTAWLGGTVLFAGYVNWTVNGRSVLPLVPAAAILMCRQMDWVSQSFSSWKPPRAGAVRRAWFAIFRAPPSAWQWLPLVPAAVLTYIVADADYRLALNNQKAAAELSAIAHNILAVESEPGKPTNRSIWFVGHWGFQYYMELGGAEPVSQLTPNFKKGDLFIRPLDNVNQTSTSNENSFSRNMYKYDGSPWAATHSRFRRAGFYADRWGPLPFVFGDEWQSDPAEAEKTKNIHQDIFVMQELSKDLGVRHVPEEEPTDDL